MFSCLFCSAANDDPAAEVPRSTAFLGVTPLGQQSVGVAVSLPGFAAEKLSPGSWQTGPFSRDAFAGCSSPPFFVKLNRLSS